MSEDQTPDPGGTNMITSTPQGPSNIKDQDELLIAQLKEMLRNEQSNISQEKVDEYVNTLNKARAKRSQKRSEGTSSSSTSGTTTTNANIDANKKERVNLLRQQLEQNKARLAQRGKSQKGIEEMVIQLQAQLNDSQTLVTSTPLNISLVEGKGLDYNENTSQKELYNILLTKEKKITDILSKSEKLEGFILDLQENLKEKDSVIDARTKAVTLMSDSLSKKGKNTLDALEETKDQMRMMQENFVTLEAEMKARQLSLLNDLKVKNFEISELQKRNELLTKENLEAKSKLAESSALLTTAEDNVKIETMTEAIDLQLKNDDLKKMDMGVDQAKVVYLQKTLDEVSEQNADYVLRISQLETQLKGALLRLEEKDTSIDNSLQHDDGLLEENKKLNQENEEHLLNIHELEGTVLKLKEFEQKYIETTEVLNRVTEEKERFSRKDSESVKNIRELEKQLDDALTELRLLKNTGMTKSAKPVKEDSEITKLKKQIDESNKNMIKMRAVQKGKIKELNKKLDQFKKMNDSNVLITQLQNEIVKLNEKIAELEDDKGNLQLKMVDSTSSKDDSAESEEEIKQLKEKLNQTEQEINEKDKVIEILEAEVIALKSDLQMKNEQELKVSTQVSSEMSSICYEEQIEILESGKKKLLDELRYMNAEKENFLQELELTRKEKQDISAKLDSYIQENIELIDKLEKLSAEKVSSAESIEIVEGLTQQEKLELAAYQKHLNPEERLKCTEEDSLEPPAELNESVLQLSEDTAELLQKIEMFTQERKEVMQKMESLKDENNLLNIKIKEIENNRDILEETYEQVQNEKDVLLNEKQQLAEKLLKIQKDEEVKTVETSVIVLDTELKELQVKCEALIQENDKLKNTIKEFDSIIQEKFDLEQRLRDVLENNTSLDIKLNSNLDEINTYQLTIEENKTELISSAGIINKLNNQLEEREQDIQELHMNISELNSVISELQSKESEFTGIEAELNNLKSTLNDQITAAGGYESEIIQNKEIIRNLNGELVRLNGRILELETQIELKDNEIDKLTKDILNKDAIITCLQEDIEKKNQTFKIVSEDMKGKYLQLKNQLDNNDNSLQMQVTELTNKNKDQMEKMKKIAANLKKKSHLYQELEDRYKTEEENWKIEQTQSSKHIVNLEEKIASVTQALALSENNLDAKLQQISILQNEIRVLTENVEILDQNNADQQHYIQELKHKQEKISETSLQQEMSTSLHEDVDSSFPQHVPDDKIRELELLMETNESQLSDYKEKLDRLQEDLRMHQETKEHLEAFNAELVEKLKLTSNSFKEKALLQDQLELRLAEISANDEALSKKLQETQVEHDELLKKTTDHEDLIKKLKIKLKKAHDKVTELKMTQENLQELEATNNCLRNQITALEDNQRHIQNENESLQKRVLSDYEKIETDYQMQLEELLKTKNDLTIDNEKLSERIKELEEKEQELTSELVEYKNRIDEIERNKAGEIKLLLDDHKAAKLQNAELSSELNDADLKLQESLRQIVDLGEELRIAQNQLVTLDSMQKFTRELTIERDEQLELLKQQTEVHEQVKAESTGLKQALEHSENALQIVSQEKATLEEENKQLKQEIINLEFAKSSLEASCQSSQKPFEMPVTEALINSAPILQLPEAKTVPAPENAVLAIGVLREQLNNAKEELQKAVDEVQILKSALNEKLCENNVKTELNKKSSENSLDGTNLSPILEATNSSKQIPLFNAFAEHSSDSGSVFDNFGATGLAQTNWYNIANPPLQSSNNTEVSVNIDEHQSQQQPQSFSPVVQDGREFLLQKIKTLEFLLYNVDKEKEIALDQCTEMVNELTQLICNKSAQPETNLESQILSQATVDNLSAGKADLQATEYTPIHKHFGQQATPVKEEIVEPKSAYICFGEEAPTKDDDVDKAEVLEPHTMSDRDVVGLATNKTEVQKLEYDVVDLSLGEQQQQVIEPLAQPKHAYLCYSKDDKPQSIEAFEENDDGWGWGPEEARLEEEHISTLENTPQLKSLLLEVQQLKEIVRVLQVERENNLEEIKQLQVKSGKLIKKCKELKIKTEKTVTHKKHDEASFFDLNETIQDELKTQVSQLEKKLKELSVEHEKDRAERINLLKRVDVLTSANDRMTEMKEIQDSEVFRLQRKYDEMEQKLQEYEWGSDDFRESQKQVANPAIPSTLVNSDQMSKIKQLEDTIKDLSLDNEELQTLLEEQHFKKVEVEKVKNTGIEQELIELRNINETLHKELNESKTCTVELQKELNRIASEKSDLERQKVSLEDTLQKKDVTVQQLKLFTSLSHGIDLDQTEVFDLNNQTSTDKEVLKAKDVIIEDLHNKLQKTINEKSDLDMKAYQLQQDLTTKEDEVQKLVCSLDDEKIETEKLRSEINNLKISVDAQGNVINNVSVCMEQLKTEKAALEGDISDLTNKLQCYEAGVIEITADNKQKELNYQTLQQELQSKVMESQEYQAVINELQTRVREMEAFATQNNGVGEENITLMAQLHNKNLELEEKERLLKNLQLQFAQNEQTLKIKNELLNDLTNEIKQEGELHSQKSNTDAEIINRLSAELENKEHEFQDRMNTFISELNENWKIQADQRACDVDQTWKRHLEVLEKDYTLAQDKMKFDIMELEEKCNILVNENNELRKNVDQEIRSEVDKISALQEQISNLQRSIKLLGQQVVEKDKQIEELQNNLCNYLSLENELQGLRTDNAEKENKLASINVIIETTQKQFDEKREVVEDIVSVLENRALFPISYEKQDILCELQRQLEQASGRDSEIVKLNETINELDLNLKRFSGEKDREITGLNQIIEDLERELGAIHEKDADIVRLSSELKNVLQEKNQLTHDIELNKQEKDTLSSEIAALKSEYSQCLVTIEDLKQRIETSINTQQSLQQNLDEKCREIHDLNQYIFELQQSDSNDSNKEVENLYSDLTKMKNEYLVLQGYLSEWRTQLTESNQQLVKKTQELQAANEKIIYYQQSCEEFDQNNKRLNELLNEREKEYNNSLNMFKNNIPVDMQRHYDELISNKDLDINALKGHIHELITANQSYVERLNQEIASKEQIQQQLFENTQLVDEDTKQLEELKLIIEDQVTKIEQLKKELFDKSNQYDSLIAEVDVGRPPITRQPLSAAPTSPVETRQQYEDDDLSAPASRAELDVALYMLHQRDVRCEELTVELTQLLEERDILQLRLSNAIREKEELRSRSDVTLVESSVISNPSQHEDKSFTTSTSLSKAGAESTKDPMEGEKNLATKLSELRNVGYKKDKTFVDEQDARRIQQLAIMQQHINEVSKLPPEAAAKLVDASYTLSRDVQSPSKVLLNWLWGKNPPKANES